MRTIEQGQISLRAARVNANLTQKEAAKRLGISNSTLLKWEKGADSPKVKQFRNMCKLYSVKEDDIFLP